MKFKILVLILIILTACKNEGGQLSKTSKEILSKNIVTDNYELDLPKSKINGLLILFGGYPERAKEIRKEFGIQELAIQKGIAVMLMNFNQRLWLEEKEKRALANILTKAINTHDIKTENIYIGGFSSGGNVSLLLANHLNKNNNSIKAKGVFIIDSPVDLYELYNCSKRNVDRKFSDVSVMESQRTISLFDEYFGVDLHSIKRYEQFSPYVYSTNTIKNLKFLENIRLRMYTEPDTIWWKKNRMNEYEDMNAYYIKKMAIQLDKEFTQGNIELIETKNKGVRSNGYRHPHSWSIVDKEDLVQWILANEN